jgi:hypothetical protein
MENINERDPIWRESGKAFIESVTKLLERLLDYREVVKVNKTSVPIKRCYLAEYLLKLKLTYSKDKL